MTDPASWMDESFLLEEQIKSHSTLQKTGPKMILEVNNSTQERRILVEVVGIPSAHFDNTDMEPCDVLICSLPQGPFELSFEEIFTKAQSIQKGINLSLQNFYHIVFDGHKIALHFFIQKDYIHSEH